MNEVPTTDGPQDFPFACAFNGHASQPGTSSQNGGSGAGPHVQLALIAPRPYVPRVVDSGPVWRVTFGYWGSPSVARRDQYYDFLPAKRQVCAPRTRP
jgi:hypothetical protein